MFGCCQKREGQKLHLWLAGGGGTFERQQPKELVTTFPPKAAAEGEEEGREHGAEQVGETRR